MEQHDEFSPWEEVGGDFRKALEKINFKKYNPNSAEFTNALRMGLMWHLLREVDGIEPTEKPETSKSDDEIADEISGAKRYLQRFIETSDTAFRDMASDELRHAEILLKKANARLPGGEEKQRLKEYESEIREVYGQIQQN